MKKTIDITVGLDDKQMPETIEWRAEDMPEKEANNAKAMLLSFYDENTMDTLKIDLWTKKMQVNEMDRFFYQTLRGLADTYFRATNNRELAVDMQKFVQYFGESTEVIKKVEE